VEPLERRQMLAGGTLTVTGTAQTQKIAVQFSPDGSSIATNLDGVQNMFAGSAVRSLVVDGGPGFERVHVEELADGYGTTPTKAAMPSILVDAGNGGSSILVQLDTQAGARVVVNGGSGDDQIFVAAAGTTTRGFCISATSGRRADTATSPRCSCSATRATPG
jgi:hypothetical protein